MKVYISTDLVSGKITNISFKQTDETNIEAIWDGLPDTRSELNGYKKYVSKTDNKVHIYFDKEVYNKYVEEEKVKQEKLDREARQNELLKEMSSHIEEKEVESDKEGYKKIEVKLGELVLWSYYTENSSTENNG